MSQEINKKIYQWLGWNFYQDNFCEGWETAEEERISFPPDFLSLDSDAIALLPVLVERGYIVSLDYHPANNPKPPFDGYRLGWHFTIYDKTQTIYCHNQAPIISQAICTAIIELIDREAK